MTFYSNKKQKSYVLNPRGKPLYEDSNRFGTKMLEKMGWSKGKGLGTNLDGELNFIRVSHKDNTEGIGFQDRDDQWTQHENDFNSLLKSLDNSREQSDNEKSDESEGGGEGMACRGFGFTEKKENKKKKSESITSKISGKSLEEMSKNSRARVHYKKFTRGKDLSKYSAKDLANIFGKKLGEDINEPKNGAEIEEREEEEEEEEETTSNYGIMTIETGKTIDEYFCSQKLNRNAEKDSSERKKGKKRKDEEIAEETVEVAEEEIKKEKKKKKKKKKDKQKHVDQEEEVISNDNSNDSNIEVKEKKKKRKPESEKIESETVKSAEVETLEEKNLKNNKKKSKRHKLDETNDKNVDISEVIPKANPLISNILSSLSFANQDYVNLSSTDETSTCKGETLNQSSLELTKFAHETYELNRFQAELFRFVDLDAFKDSNISDLSGYGYGDKIELKVTAKTQDQNKINDLWDSALINKYGRDAVKSKKKKQYALKKKSVFRAI